MQDLSYWKELLHTIYGGKRFIITGGALSPTYHVAKILAELGAESLCVASSRGASAPEESDFQHPPVIVNELIDMGPLPPSRDTMSDVRQILAILEALPDEAKSLIDAFDPNHEARCIGPIFDDGAPFYGRDKFGARTARWQALEDKTIIDALWDEAGVTRAPVQIVDFDLDALTKAHRELDLDGSGSVFAVDNGNGFHGGASGTQWIQNTNQVKEFIDHFAQDHIQKVRVMPFLEGLPCSIHGFVFPETTITLRPCEMLIFRAPGRRRFYYGGSATFWTPDNQARDEMRSLARRVGEHLSTHYQYRGAFTVDGVLTTQGFRPTELNPRFGAALGYVGAGLDGLSLLLLNLAIVEGVDVNWKPNELETLIREAAESHRRGALGMNVPSPPTQPWSMPLHRSERGWHIATHEQPALAKLSYGPTSSGGYVRVSPDPEHITGPEPFAPTALELLRFAITLFGLDLPLEELEHARWH